MTDLASFPEHFRERVEALPNGCWRWTRGTTGKAGYGCYYVSGKNYLAHRWAWQHIHGELNDRRVQLDHFRHPGDGCIGATCANPDHVRPTTPRENTLRGNTVTSANLAKTHCVNGHEYTPENTRYSSLGWRECISCRRDKNGYKGNPPAADRTHCPEGHEYTVENTYVRPNGGRKCRQCNRDKERQRQKLEKASRCSTTSLAVPVGSVPLRATE